jgi:putative ABC transport system substrate-binding protein
MKRREFLGWTGAVALWPFSLRAQHADRKRRIGTLFAAPADDALAKRTVSTIVRELDRLGWKEGMNVTLHHHYVANVAGLADAAKELIALEPDVIFALTTPAAKAAMNATQRVPIVFAAVSDPLGTGLVGSLARPGANVTGFSNAVAPLAGKWLELVRELDPSIGRVGLMFNPDSSAARGAASLRELLAAATHFKIHAAALEVRSPDDIAGFIAGLGEGARGALLVTQDVFNANNRGTIIAAAAQHRVPAVFPFRFYVVEGGLISYGVDVFEGIRQAVSYLDRILKGAKPGDLPVQQPLKFELVINLKTAKALGLVVSPTLLTRANEVIE